MRAVSPGAMVMNCGFMPQPWQWRENSQDSRLLEGFLAAFELERRPGFRDLRDSGA